MTNTTSRTTPSLGRRALSLGAASLAALPAAVRAQSADGGLAALTAAAKTEGELVFYTGATEVVARRAAEAFSAKYGIKTSFTRIAGGPLLQRFGAEASVGTFAADLILVAGGAVEFLKDGLSKSWLEPVDAAAIPAIQAGTFPAAFLRDGGAVIQVSPWGICYNTDSVKPADIPKTWQDLLKPRFKGRILIADTKGSAAYLDVWAQLADAFGPDFYAALRAQNPRWYDSGVPATQALAAGEGDLQIPAVDQQVRGLIDKGAPASLTYPSPSTGVEMFAILTHRSRIKHNAAARLFVNFLMTAEGNKLFNSDPGNFSVFDTAKLPAGYASPKPGTASRNAEIRKLLGLG